MDAMNRRAFLASCAAGLVCARPALAAEDLVADIVRQLERLGYDEITVARTLLGRTRITARGRRGEREIILNPATGEILRDLQTGGSGGKGILDEGGGNSGPGGGDQDDDGDDDDDDDDDGGGDDSGGGDNSGSGGGGGHDDGDDDDDD